MWFIQQVLEIIALSLIGLSVFILSGLAVVGLAIGANWLLGGMI